MRMAKSNFKMVSAIRTRIICLRKFAEFQQCFCFDFDLAAHFQKQSKVSFLKIKTTGCHVCLQFSAGRAALTRLYFQDFTRPQALLVDSTKSRLD